MPQHSCREYKFAKVENVCYSGSLDHYTSKKKLMWNNALRWSVACDWMKIATKYMHHHINGNYAVCYYRNRFSGGSFARQIFFVITSSKRRAPFAFSSFSLSAIFACWLHITQETKTHRKWWKMNLTHYTWNCRDDSLLKSVYLIEMIAVNEEVALACLWIVHYIVWFMPHTT